MESVTTPVCFLTFVEVSAKSVSVLGANNHASNENSRLIFHFPTRPPSGINSKCPLPINNKTGFACTALSRNAFAFRLMAVIPRKKPRNRSKSPLAFLSGSVAVSSGDA